MSKSKATKRALVSSTIAMLLCIAMLVGTTFAWFTDTAATAVNKIQAGTLDVQLLDENGNSIEGETLTWVTADNRDQNDIFWEPGCTYELQQFKIKNNGDLALKYKISITGIVGDSKLLEAIDFTVSGIDAETAADLDGFVGSLGAGDSTELITIIGHMKESAGNEYQGLSIDGIGITVLATQDTVEKDSFDDQYDANAEYAVAVATADEFAEALASGNDVILAAPIQMPEVIEIKNDVTIYGEGDGKIIVPDNADRVINVNENTEPVTLTLSGVDVVGPTTGTYTRGISLYGNSDVTIVVDNSSVSANYYALNIASYNENVDVVIKNSTITGWCAFQTWSAGTKATFENCTLIGNNDKDYNADGWNDYSTITINTTAEDTELVFNNCRIEANQTTGNIQYLLSVRASGAKITINDCEFISNGEEIAADELGYYLELYYEGIDMILTIDGYQVNILG